MIVSICELPDDILLEIFTRYVSVKDLCRLEQVCRQFHNIIRSYPSPWKNALVKLTNVSSSELKNAAGCPSLENIRPSPSVISHQFHLPDNYECEILLDRTSEFPQLLAEDYRRPSNQLITCSKLECDTNRLTNNYRYLTSLAYRWNREDFIENTIIKFVRRSQTSLLQYDEHNHKLWFTCDRALRGLKLDASVNHLECYQGFNDDILCYNVYNDHFMSVAHGNQITVICRQTSEFYPCEIDPIFYGERNDILSMDVYSNDQERYLILSGSRDHTVSMKTFDMSRRTNQSIWRTRIDDRVLCSRFTSDGQYFLIGTGGTSSLYPLVLFNTERARPLHLYNANYRLGAGVRCIEWVSSNVFIAAGFDNQFKEFDLRTGLCHYTFNDPFANDYCSLAVSVDHNNNSNGILLGGNHHSTVRLVNRRQRQIQKIYFVSKQASPVHSLVATSEYLFASVDRSIVALDFTKSDPYLGRLRCRF